MILLGVWVGCRGPMSFKPASLIGPIALWVPGMGAAP